MISINIISGANEHNNVSVSNGYTVGDLREDFGSAFGIPYGSNAVIDGVNRSDDYALRDGDTITFQKETGTKA